MIKFSIIYFGYAILSLGCTTKSQQKRIDHQIVDSIVHMAFNNFMDDIGPFNGMHSEQTFIIDTIAQPYDYIELEIMDNFPLVDRYSEKIRIDSRETRNTYSKYLKKFFPSGKIKLDDDSLIKMPNNDFHEKLREKALVVFKYSDIFYIVEADQYYMSFSYYCGRGCGGQYTMLFGIDDNGKLVNVRIKNIWV